MYFVCMYFVCLCVYVCLCIHIPLLKPDPSLIEIWNLLVSVGLINLYIMCCVLMVGTCQLRVSRGQPALSAAGQPSLNRSFPTASEWNHTPQPAAQQSNSALSYVPEYAAEAVEEGLTMEEGLVLDTCF